MQPPTLPLAFTDRKLKHQNSGDEEMKRALISAIQIPSHVATMSCLRITDDFSINHERILDTNDSMAMKRHMISDNECDLLPMVYAPIYCLSHSNILPDVSR